VRVGMLLCSPAGNDLLYDDSLPEQGRNFANKIWNAFRLVRSWKVDDSISQPESSKVAVKWMEEILKKTIAEIDLNFRKFRISEALMTVYKLFWDEFSGWYLEIIKPEYKKPVDRITFDNTISVFEQLLKLIHPFMPFITEEIWQLLAERAEGESIMISRMPDSKKYNKDITGRFELLKETVSAVRNVRREINIENREELILCIKAEENSYDREFLPVLSRLVNLSEIKFVGKKQDGAVSFMIGTTEYFIPLSGNINISEEIIKIQEELVYLHGFLGSVMKKLNNVSFVANAPANVLQLERKKRSDTEKKIRSLEDRLRELDGQRIKE
jgi:valyl-tRNA synthetase